MKRLLLCLLLLCLPASQAPAETDTPALHYIDYGDGVQPIDLLPRMDGGLLLCGYTYSKNTSQEGSTSEEGLPTPHVDAFAIALDAEGNEEWHLRIGDPEAINSFSAAAPIRDGNFLLTYKAAMGTWGTQHYIISSDGVVEEMLSARELREKGLLFTLRPVDGGFIGGGYDTLDGIGLEPMKETPHLQYIDRHMAEVWRFEDDALYGCLFEVASAGEDGFAFCGTHYEITDTSMSALGPVLLRLDASGAILWQKKLPASSNTWITNVLMLEDGNLLVCGSGDPGDPDNALPGGTLSKFDREGNRLWTKGYHITEGLYTLTDIAPLGEGFAITDGMAGGGVYYVDADGEVLGRYRPPVVDNAYVSLFPAPDGSLYLLGSIATPTDEINDTDPLNRAFYVKLTVSDFAPAEQ